ncbi:MAG TPA: hypothetical protein VFU22_07960 [Roseiflexaceae bacterium]|nr:hypothetical protein [Roseiflexaceae bacterium]
MKQDIEVHKNNPIQLTEQPLAKALVNPTVTIPTRITARLVSHSEIMWGWLPALSVIVAAGVMLVALAYTGSRAGKDWAEFPFWFGILTFSVPVAVRLLAAKASRQERMGLVVLVGLSYYLVKVLHSPVAFTFSDEPVHSYNVTQILATQHLFHENHLLKATPLYPGLAIVTSAIVTLSGLSIFSAGLLVIGVARITLVLALFLLYERASGSSRVAGVAALFYMANPNFTFYSAQYAYESLALPIAMVCLMTIVRRLGVARGAQRIDLTIVILLTLMAVEMTHHMTSYAITMLLFAWWLISLLKNKLQPRLTKWYERLVGWGTQRIARLRHSGVGGDRMMRWWITFTSPEPNSSTSYDSASSGDIGALALIAAVSTLAWLVYIAGVTISYLSPVFLRTVRALIALTAGDAPEGTSRQLFRSTSGYVAPLWEQATALGSVVFLLLGLPLGLYVIWRRYRGHTLALVLSGGALVYFGLLGLRFLPSGWEMANRSSEFLFVGIGFVLGLGIVEVWSRYRAGWAGKLLFMGFMGVIVLGGVILGWSPNGRFARPYLVQVGTHTVEPQGVTAAKWSRTYLGPDHIFATDASNARLLLAFGQQHPYTGERYGIRDMLLSGRVGWAETEILQTMAVQYVLVDRRVISWDQLVGYYFNRAGTGDIQQEQLLEPNVYRKFDKQQYVSRFYDSGNIVIYDVGAVSGVAPVK